MNNESTSRLDSYEGPMLDPIWAASRTAVLARWCSHENVTVRHIVELEQVYISIWARPFDSPSLTKQLRVIRIMCWVIVQGEAKFVRYAVLLESFAARQGASWYLYQTERPREVERHLHWFTARYESFLLLHSQRIAAKTTRHQCRRSARKVAGALLRRRTCAHVPSSQIKRKRNPKKEKEVLETMIFKPNRNSVG